MNVTRAEFEQLKDQVDELSESTLTVTHLVAGGINMTTKQYEKGVMQHLDELVTQMKGVTERVDSFISGIADFGRTVGRLMVPALGTILLALAGWFAHFAWPSIAHTITGK